MANNNDKRRGRGFASLSPEERQEIASKGGKAAHDSGNAHEWDSEEARKAGQKGGQNSRNSDLSAEGLEGEENM